MLEAVVQRLPLSALYHRYPIWCSLIWIIMVECSCCLDCSHYCDVILGLSSVCPLDHKSVSCNTGFRTHNSLSVCRNMQEKKPHKMLFNRHLLGMWSTFSKLNHLEKRGYSSRTPYNYTALYIIHMSMLMLFLNGRSFEWHATKQMSNTNQTFIYLFTLTWIALEIELGVES